MAGLSVGDIVRTREELDTLPPGSYLLARDEYKHARVWPGEWILCVAHEAAHHDGREIELPALVLYRG